MISDTTPADDTPPLALPAGSSPFQRVELVARRYRLLRQLGRGGMASVYEAQDISTGAAVAVKLLHLRRRDDRDARKRFALEVRAATRVNHSALVRVLDAGIHDKLPFIVMELVHGNTLDDHVCRHGAIDPRVALRLFGDVACGLGEAHAAGVIHRDLKPANMLLTLGESGEPCIKVTDFGYARVSDRSITAEGVIVGTSNYMAPEQVLGEQVDARTDIYALGVSLFFALTGELPFACDKRARALAHQVFSKPPPPSWLVDGLAPCVDEIVGTATRKDPARRYPTMAAFGEDIDSALTSGEVRGADALRRGDDRYRPASQTARRLAAALARQLVA